MATIMQMAFSNAFLLKKSFWFEISLIFVHKGLIDNKSELV